AHLALRQEKSPLAHLVHTVAEPRYRLAFALVVLLATGGYMLMPFGTAFIVFMGPLVGKVSDSVGKFNTYCFGSILAIVMVAIWTNLGRSSLPFVIAINILLYLGIFS